MNQNIRFKVFQRDDFSCQYCGRKTPEVVLEVDHIIPISKNGTDEIENLITSCFDCNRGKGANNLKEIPQQERSKQLKEFYKYQKQIEKRNKEIISELLAYWMELYANNFSLSVRGEATVRRFLNNFGKDEIKDAMAIAFDKNLSNIDRIFAYFCGVMWTKLKNRNKEIEWK